MARYFFQHWQDGDPNVQRTLTVGTLDITLVATYAPAYIMNITSTPPTVVRFDMGTPLVQEQTPFSNVLQAGTYMLVAEDLTISGYRFKRWSDGIITASRTYVHDHDMTAPLMIEYELIPLVFDFSIGASPSSQPVTVGNATSFAVVTTLVAGTSQTVTLSVSGLPLNTTSGFSQVSGNPPFASTLNIQTNTNTPTGSYPLTITGTGGSVSHQVNVTLVVNPAAAFDFSINASPTSQPVTVGNGTSFAVNTQLLSGTAETVNLSIAGLPSNTSSSFSPSNGYPPFTSTLNIQTNANTPIGSYPLTITGSGGGQNHQANVTLIVNPVQVQRGTIQVKALIGSAEVTNATGDIKDINNTVMDTFAATPHSWDQAVVGVQYTVTCRLAGYADKVDTATVTTEGGSVSKAFQFRLEAGFPLWVVVVAGGGLAVVGLIMATRKKKG